MDPSENSETVPNVREQTLDEKTVELLDRWREGDEQAADAMFARYVARLIGLARSRMSPALRRRVDAEDIVQSAYRTFFVNAREDRYVLRRSGDLWRLLVGITMNKLHRHIEFHSAGKRSIKREESLGLRGDDSVGMKVEAVASGPTPDEAVAIVEELDRLMMSLPELHREILERRLQGQSVDEIAEEVERSARTVRRVLERVRGDLEQQLQANAH